MRTFITFLLVFPFFILTAQEAIDTISIEEVSISVSRAAEADPVTYTNVELAEIEAIYNGQDAAVVLQQLTPSIISYSDAGTDIGNYAQFRLRGISQSRINITLNGIPLNDMVDQGVYFSNFSDFGNSIQSIQVQRGVAASSAGVASFAGAVNFESINLFGEEQPSEVQLTAGSFGTLRGSAEMHSLSQNGKLGSYGRFTKTQTDGYKYTSGSDSYSAFGSIGYLVGDGIIKFTGFMGKTENGQSYLPVLLSDIESDPKTNYNHPNDTDDFEQELFSLQYATALSPSTHLETSLYYGGARGEFPFSIDNATKFEYGLSNSHYGLISHVSHQRDGLTLKGGLQGYLFDRRNYEYEAPNQQLLFDEDFTDKNELSLFGKVGYQVSDVTVYADVQYRNIALDMTDNMGVSLVDENWGFFNYVAGASYQLNEQSAVYASYGHSMREPTRSDIRNGVTEEESVNDIELGWRFRSPKLALQANLFHMALTNEITGVGALQEMSYIEIRQNVPKSRRSGLELSMQYTASQLLDLSLNAAYLDANVESYDFGNGTIEDLTQVFSPKVTLSPRVQLHASEKASFALSALYASEAYMELANLPEYTMPAFTVLNASADFQLMDRVGLNVQLNNLLNERYYTDGAPVDQDYDGIPEGPGYRVQPPRHFYATLKIRL